MKRLLIFAALLLTVGLSSCQCADKPDVGPVEGENQQSQLVVPGPDAPRPVLHRGLRSPVLESTRALTHSLHMCLVRRADPVVRRHAHPGRKG